MENELDTLATMLRQHRPALVLTGAGLSTASGIPAYRNEDGKWIHPRPVLAAEFKSKDRVRRRYWRRSLNGWPNFSAARPNQAHLAITKLQRAGIFSGIVTQNVDGLHLAAGADNVIELHGALRDVICLDCGHQMRRADLQTDLLTMNPQFTYEKFTQGADGDATPIDSRLVDEDFQYPDCPKCRGMLKPDVVFFGENVPAHTVEAGRAALEQSANLICVGTTLTVLSGFRYCRDAAAQNKPILIVNRGKTRADDMAAVKVPMDCSTALTTLAETLCG